MQITETTPHGTPLLPSALPLVLMVEDNADDARLLREALRESGLAVRLMTATDSRQAFGALRLLSPMARPRLILIDLNLPAIRGHDILRELSSQPSWKSIPTVVLTASTRETDRTTSLALGAREHIVKPNSYLGYLALAESIRTYL